MVNILQYTQKANALTVTPALVHSKLGKLNENLIAGRMEDAHEFTKHLLAAMTKKYLEKSPNSNRLNDEAKKTTPIGQIFGFSTRDEITCSTCGNVKFKQSHEEDMSLPIEAANSLHEAMTVNVA